MRKLLLAGLVAGALTLSGTAALAHGPGGSHEEDSTQSGTTWDNEVTCGSNNATPVGDVYAGANGVEACNDNAANGPVQGRIIVTSDGGGYVAADGDASNDSNAQGFIRIDGGGVRCADTGGDKDATHPGASDGVEDCAP